MLNNSEFLNSEKMQAMKDEQEQIMTEFRTLRDKIKNFNEKINQNVDDIIKNIPNK